MWTGTPYDRWQKRLGVALFLVAVAVAIAAGLLHDRISREAGDLVVHSALVIIAILFAAMAGLLALKKLYFTWKWWTIG